MDEIGLRFSINLSLSFSIFILYLLNMLLRKYVERFRFSIVHSVISIFRGVFYLLRIFFSHLFRLFVPLILDLSIDNCEHW